MQSCRNVNCSPPEILEDKKPIPETQDKGPKPIKVEQKSQDVVEDPSLVELKGAEDIEHVQAAHNKVIKLKLNQKLNVARGKSERVLAKPHTLDSPAQGYDLRSTPKGKGYDPFGPVDAKKLNLLLDSLKAEPYVI